MRSYRRVPSALLTVALEFPPMTARAPGPKTPRARGRRYRSGLAPTLALTLALTLVAGCSAGATGTTSTTDGSPTLTGRDLAAGAGHACIVAGSGHPTVDWAALRNPVLSSPSGGVKDEALIWAAGTWHMLFSYVTIDRSLPGGVRWDVATSTSRDLVHWSAISPWPRQAGVLGVASPDIVREPDGVYVVTYQSDPGGTSPPGIEDRLYYRTSTDLATWSAPRPLAQTLAPSADDRMIDGALVFTGSQLLLGFKYSSGTQPQVFEIARSTTGLPQGPWTLVGRPDIEVDGGTIENYEFVTAAGHWRLVATSNNLDQPWIFTLAGRPDTAVRMAAMDGRVRPRHPLRAVQQRAGHLQHRVRARQFGLPVRRQLAARPLLLPGLCGQ